MNPIVVPQKEEESTWSKISKVMGFANTAANIATGVDGLVNKPDPMLKQLDQTKVAGVPQAVQQYDNSLMRLRYRTTA